MEKENKNQGITLIALVITIIVLLILAGVTIATLTGDNGLLQKATDTKSASNEGKLEEEVKLAFSEYKIDKYTDPNASLENKLESIFEKIYGTENIDVAKSGRNYKIKVKDSKTCYRVRYDGTVEKYEEMDQTNIYARLDDDGTMYLRATKYNDDYKLYSSSDSIQSSWNTNNNATKDSVIKVIIEEPIAPITVENMFRYCSKLENIENIENLHTENASSTQQMFFKCSSLKSLDVSRFDTNKSTSMNSMFNECSKLEVIDVSGFDTAKVVYMNTMFANCRKVKVLDTNKFNTSNVILMNGMFDECSSLIELDVSNFDTSKATSMSYMFEGCSSLKKIDVSNFNVEKASSLECMFYKCSSLNELNLKSFNTSNITDIHSMFNSCSNLTTLDLTSFDTNKVNQMRWIFKNCSKLKNIEMSDKFKINDNTDCLEMIDGVQNNIKITAIQNTAQKIINNSNLTIDNFNLIE